MFAHGHWDHFMIHWTYKPFVELGGYRNLINQPAELRGCPQNLAKKVRRATMGQSVHFCVTAHTQKVKAELQLPHLNFCMLQMFLRNLKVVLTERFSLLCFSCAWKLEVAKNKKLSGVLMTAMKNIGRHCFTSSFLPFFFFFFNLFSFLELFISFFLFILPYFILACISFYLFV